MVSEVKGWKGNKLEVLKAKTERKIMPDKIKPMKVVTQVVVESAQAAILTMAKTTEGNTTPTQTTGQTKVAKPFRSRTGGLCLNQPTFNWASKNKYTELKQFEMKVADISLTKHTINHVERRPIVENLLTRAGLQCMQALTLVEQESCEPVSGIFKTLDGKFRWQHSETILFLNYCKLKRKKTKSYLKTKFPGYD